ncbi:hypothetical protein [Bradyrhizobium sp. NP1]|uniref:hypothetical protein n=1 Tax=Bradyrhizobium sp. NP1 TaxID=3049772 RepID=UPI0025A567D8|nr:hypothetical protein [Bradyrhizobium sp. NP1]WJR75106.1 hypothetical protein QOU61_20045 [Bradyrhizobium sp. NP1]
MSQPIAFVLLQNSTLPNLQLLVDALRQRHPDRPWAANAPSSIQCGDQVVALTLVDAPRPKDDALWERAKILWRDGGQIAARHRAHVTLSMTEANTGELERARIATAVIGGLVSTLPEACAVIWKDKIGRSPQTWLEFSQSSFAPPPGYPFVLWIDILPFKSVESVGALTVGLSSFTGREIECDLPGMALPTLVERVGMIASQLIGRGDGIKDGEVFVVSATDRIKVHYAVSRFNGSPVLRVGAQSPSAPVKRYPVISPATARDHPLLSLLTRAGLFDASGADNHVELQPASYDSEARLDSYDQGISGVLSKILASDAYVAADQKARDALARGDTGAAREALLPFAGEVTKLQGLLKQGLTQGRVFMFLPKQTSTRLS